MRSAPCGTWSAPDQAQTWRAGADLPHHPGPRERRVRATRAAFTATVSSTPRACSTSKLRLKSKPNIRFAGLVSHRPRGLAKARPWVSWRPASQPPSYAVSAALPPVETARWERYSAHITGGADATIFQPMERELRPNAPHRRADARKADRKKAYTDRARAGLAAWLEVRAKVNEPA